MPVTAARTVALPVVRVWSVSRGRRRRRLATRARRPFPGSPCGGHCPGGHCLRRLRTRGQLHPHPARSTHPAPAGLRVGLPVQGRGRARLALVLDVPLRTPRRRCWSWPRGQCWRARSSAAPGGAALRRTRRTRAEQMSPAHHIREPRWRILLVVAAVIVGVAVAAGAKGAPTAPAAPARPTALVERAQCRVVGVVLHGPVDVDGGRTGLPRPHQHAAAVGQRHCDHGDRRWSHGHLGRAGPGPRRHGTEPPGALDGVVAGPDRHGRRGWRRRLTSGARLVGLGRVAVPEHDLVAVVLPRRDDRQRGGTLPVTAQPDVHARGRRPELHDAVWCRAPHQLPGSGAATRLGGRRERRVGGPERLDRQHRRHDAHRARRRVRIAGVRCALGGALGGARGGGAPVALDDPPSRRGNQRFLGDRRLQPRRRTREGRRAPAPRLRSARAAHRARLRRGRPGRSRPVRRHGSRPELCTRPMSRQPVVRASWLDAASPCRQRRHHPRPARPSPSTARARRPREEPGSFHRRGPPQPRPSAAPPPTPWR